MRGLLAVGGFLLWLRVGGGQLLPGLAEPGVGHRVDVPPPAVRIWFDGQIEPVFSTVHVENADKQRVDKGDARIDPKDDTLIQVSLPPLPPGRYRVFWSVIARDGHRTVGDFSFRIK